MERQWCHEKDVQPEQVHRSELTLFDFRAPEDRAEVDDGSTWRVWTDEVMGGKSTCSWTSSEEDGGKAIFAGTLSKFVPKGTSRSGFAAVQMVTPKPLKDVTEFDALKLRVKLDHNKYEINIKPESFIPDDLYQGFLMNESSPAKDGWVDAILPFRDFLLLGRGLVKQDQRAFDYNIMEALGFATNDYEGDFKIEIQSAKVICLEGESGDDARTQNLKPAQTTTSF
ncbi:Complex I intermediate-associated protein 30, mitochondrial [Hondaea fermentalgiana]|uniref:Complex I intermediate-associated protein 30, mitochondrial n=1 Tax=Hondaea fermentalgiana TaxID=2315210 RepID=A0A2R5GWU0_9STRA|nr:Complex I intermediate-associated protein 30, mitochondrial [Hondaea fermentalgiana]|eukprot:GBG32404.1 Complex I intermediate-associated protein 30, mitochondrial [Hondaea fermentalgiana]